MRSGEWGLPKPRVSPPQRVHLNVAVTLFPLLRVTTQEPVPLQPLPLQPVKVEPVAGVAVSVTTVPRESLAEQIDPQSIPAGMLVTLPAPDPLLLTARFTA